MKRFVYIQAMSMNQDDIIDKMKGRKKKVAEHLAKCAMYGDALGSSKYNHWIEHELSTWIAEINEITSKPKGKKLKQSAYANYLFGAIGDDRADARAVLTDLQLYNGSRPNPYPYVEVDEEMVDRMFAITEQMLGKVVPILSTKNNFSKTDIESLLHNLLDPICKGIEIW